MDKVGLKRLQKLIAFMETASEEVAQHFDMRLWVSHRGEHTHPLVEGWSKKDLLTCGTTACALGWAAAIPALKKAGLKLQAVAKGRMNSDIGQAFFRMTGEEFEELFIDDRRLGGSRTPAEWATGAKALLAEWSYV